jgi:hypothetical protein
MQSSKGGSNPLAASVAHLRAIDPQLCRLRGPGDSTGETWLGLDDPDEGLDLLVAAGARLGRRPDHLGASIASAVIDAIVSASLPLLLVDRRLPDLAVASVRVRLAGGELWFDAVDVRSDRCRVLQGDPEATAPGVDVVASVTDLHRTLAAALRETGNRWFPAVRRRAPFGRRGMWGQLADDVHGSALWTARVAGLDQRVAWDEAQAIVELVAGGAPELKTLPRPFPVRWSGGDALWQVKGTCCLWYTACPEEERETSFCTSCPLRGDDSRREQLRSWMETQARSIPDP